MPGAPAQTLADAWLAPLASVAIERAAHTAPATVGNMLVDMCRRCVAVVERSWIVRRPLPPLPSRTVISLRLKARCLMCSRRHSSSRVPVPRSRLGNSHACPSQLRSEGGSLVASKQFPDAPEAEPVPGCT